MINKNHIEELAESLERMNIYMFCKNKNDQFIYCNEKFAAMANVDSPQQLIGKRDRDLEWRKQAEVFTFQDAYVRNGGQILNQYQSIITRDQIYEVLHNKVQLFDLKDTCFGIIGSGMLRPSGFHPVEYTETLDEGLTKLTKGESKVFKLVILGKTAKEIAKNLMCSPRTIEDYITKIKTKLNCHHKHQLIEYALKQGFQSAHAN